MVSALIQRCSGATVSDVAVKLRKHHRMIWGVPQMGVPLVIIHFRLGFSILDHSFWGTPISGNPHFFSSNTRGPPFQGLH